MRDNFVQNRAGLFVPSHALLLPHKIGVGGIFTIEHIRNGELIDFEQVHNLVTDEGLNHLLSTELVGGSPVASWYLNLFEGNYTPLSTDTGATISGNSTETAAITSATRPAWTPGSVSGKSVSNSASRATFTFTGISGTKTMYGAFLHSNPVLASTTGTCFAAARFGTSKLVVNSDQLLITYTFNASSV